ERFMAKWDPVRMERSTRSLISRSIFHEIKEGRASPRGGVYVSATHNPPGFMRERLKEWGRSRDFTKLKRAGADLSKDTIETAYAIHYSQGGCNVNTRCETDLPGLFAIGEVAPGSKDGSDRMMSNALPYCMAMGIIAARAAVKRAKNKQVLEMDLAQVEALKRKALAPLERSNGIGVYQLKSRFQDIMQKETGYGRTEEGLKLVLGEIEGYKKKIQSSFWVSNKARRFNLEWINALEFKNLLIVGECLVRNALMRTESRGLHDRWDCPKVDPDWFKNIHLRLVDGELQQWTTPVEFTYWKPEEGSLGEPKSRGVQVKKYNGLKAEPLYEGI
ncbi:MAG: FAD-binding protein, partial [Desulfatiglandales bacterium]|nr:FAD-binding protein [Desulfatiglandales bacterium]